jgi:hypothetical protein
MAPRKGQQRGVAKKPGPQQNTKEDTRKRPRKKEAASKKGVQKAEAIQPRIHQQQTQLGDTIQHFIRKDGWPDNLFQLGPDDALRLFADRTRTRTRSTLLAEQAGSPYLS